MSEHNTQFIDYINENFTGDTQKNALIFVQYLASIGMTIEGSINDCKATYKGVTVCYFYFGSSSHPAGYPEPWTVWMPDEFAKEIDGFPIDEQMKKIAWANAHNCDECCPRHNTDAGCSRQRIIFNREYDDLCQTPIGFTGPNAEAVECAKKLMEMRKHAIDSGE
ncbi:MAG: hypothetical protein FWE06_01550 [Oscillospiraceae bacterium]|nr:hypothetical protein [Oscillospiraceae bacterium]